MDPKTPTTIRYFTCPKFTVLLETDDKGIIILGPPIVRKFIGKSIGDLHNWAANKFGESKDETIECSTSRNASIVKGGFGLGATRSTWTVAGGSSLKSLKFDFKARKS